MASAAEKLVASGHGKAIERAALNHLAAGTLVTLDIAKARHRYESLFGMECVVIEPGRMLARDRRSKHMMLNNERDYFVLDVREAGQIDKPQAHANHWGFSVTSEAEVDRVWQIAEDRKDEFGLKKIFPATNMHGSYGFYTIDIDDNWWEVEFRKGDTNDRMFSWGDCTSEDYKQGPIIDPPLPIATIAGDVLGDEAFLTHGTTSLIDCEGSRPLYENVLGLRTVRHRRPSNLFSGGGDFAVVGIGSGKNCQEQSVDYRFVVLVDGEAALDEIRQRGLAAVAAGDALSVSEVQASDDGGQSFLLRSRDRNWFEVSTTPSSFYEKAFG